MAKAGRAPALPCTHSLGQPCTNRAPQIRSPPSSIGARCKNCADEARVPKSIGARIRGRAVDPSPIGINSDHGSSEGRASGPGKTGFDRALRRGREMPNRPVRAGSVGSAPHDNSLESAHRRRAGNRMARREFAAARFARRGCALRAQGVVQLFPPAPFPPLPTPPCPDGALLGPSSAASI